VLLWALNLLSPPAERRELVTLTDRRKGMKKAYASPRLVEYGRIADCTFTTPGGVKGCLTDCHLDSFGENSALTVSGGS
jgi:hypothetical protein